MTNKTIKNKIPVKGMHCKSCEMLITDSLEELNGIKQVTASEKQGSVTVEFDETIVSLKQIKETIRKEGYEPA